ncbi:MAG: hypothetical protein V1897_10335 [Pseudomonadota bacterium]
MSKKYQQFLGSAPGLMVELISEDKSPLMVRTEDGFDFWVSSEDFREYYRQEGSQTPQKWKLFVTDPVSGQIETLEAKEAVDIINLFKKAFQDFNQARLFLHRLVNSNLPKEDSSIPKIRELLEDSAKFPKNLADQELKEVLRMSRKATDLLANDEFAYLNWPLNKTIQISPKDDYGIELKKDSQKRPPTKGTQKMKNVEIETLEETLIIRVDLSKEFGPSKSGKTIIVASTEGNKTLPGRSEKIGLNVYKDINAVKKSGNKKSFKNMEMEVNGETLTIKVDLSKELGPSKSGKTVIIGSTGGNQFVFGRSEKIGLNVYKTI